MSVSLHRKCPLLLASFLIIVTANKHGHRRFLADDSNLTALVAQLSNEIEQLKITQTTSAEMITRLQGEVLTLRQQSEGHASTYVHWGQDSCSGSDTELVYSGYAGGSNWVDSGAATNYLCLVKDPYLIGNSSFNKGAQVFGAEYLFDNGNWQATSQRLFQKDITFHDVPCAVCRVKRSTVLMVPGKNTCAAGWTLEYEGLLSAGYYDHKAGSEFVCLDKNPESVPGGYSKQLGKLFYITEAVCGSLKCPPYESGKELTCAVCSK